ncbi:MAG: hypothetical protein UR27_C0012G0004 [Candidatus Peregrinibacteria bacterium GW2011_GWA2_33_10]|nr:MAG: hypothetical protein UR27_C0012G0004 [Candidatus Peregrinibacteria bacterium GW2011_GWA2_33_10]
MSYNYHNMKKAFSLIELLVVIAITAVLIAVVLPNLLSARERARDAKKKQELNEMKNALRIYYNDYQIYPATPTENEHRVMSGCGINGTANCPLADGCEFAVKSASCTDAIVYMKRLPDFNGKDTEYNGWNYYQLGSGNKFVLFVTLENSGDKDIGESQKRCPSATYTNCSGIYTYCVCED